MQVSKFKIAEFRSSTDFTFCDQVAITDLSIDIDSIATENSFVTLIRTPESKIFDIVQIIDTEFNVYHTGYVKDINDTEIVIGSLIDTLNLPIQARNAYGLVDIEGWLASALYNSFIANPDSQQNKQYYRFDSVTTTPGSIVFENLVDGNEKIVTYPELFEKFAKEFNIYVTYYAELDANNQATGIVFEITHADENTNHYIDTNTPDVVEFSVGATLSGFNKVDFFVSDSTNGQLELVNQFVLLKDASVSEDMNHPNRVDPPCYAGFKTYSSAIVDPADEAMKFFRESINSSNEITFKIYKDSKIYDQSSWLIGEHVQIKHNGRTITAMITGKSLDSKSDNYISYICGLKRTSLTKQLKGPSSPPISGSGGGSDVPLNVIPPSGDYPVEVEVIMESAPNSVTIYTEDGWATTRVYTDPFILTETTKIGAISFLNDKASECVTRFYEITRPILVDNIAFVPVDTNDNAEVSMISNIMRPPNVTDTVVLDNAINITDLVTYRFLMNYPIGTHGYLGTMTQNQMKSFTHEELGMIAAGEEETSNGN